VGLQCMQQAAAMQTARGSLMTNSRSKGMSQRKGGQQALV
jgi:hypothetical protein